MCSFLLSFFPISSGQILAYSGGIIAGHQAFEFNMFFAVHFMDKSLRLFSIDVSNVYTFPSTAL